MTVTARYDGIADWYDENVAWSTAAATPLIIRLVGEVPAAASMWAAGLASIWLLSPPRDGRSWESMFLPISFASPGIGPGRSWPL